MKAVVLIKQVPEAPSIQGEPGGPGQVGSDSQNVTNPYDLYAIEEGIQAKEKHGAEVVAITLGPDSAVESLREALTPIASASRSTSTAESGPSVIAATSAPCFSFAWMPSSIA